MNVTKCKLNDKKLSREKVCLALPRQKVCVFVCVCVCVCVCTVVLSFIKLRSILELSNGFSEIFII